MYDSIRDWCVFPVTIHKVTGRTPGGDPKYGEPIECKGYVAEVVETITDKLGKEAVSKSRIYLPPEVDISDVDRITVFNDKMMEIRLLRRWYDGSTGGVGIQAVYM